MRKSVAFAQTEKHIYGSSRLGVHNERIELLGTLNDTYSMANIHHHLGNKTYELTNHLGNVLSVISDKVIPHNNGGTIDYWLADLRQATDYSPFGVKLHNRDLKLTSISGTFAPYRYGFNSMEKDDELKGEGNSYNFGNRIHDPRLGRFLSPDACEKNYPYYSPYIFAGNMPISAIDKNGDSLYIIIYVSGSTWHHGDDDRMFKAAAMTRKNNIESYHTFNKKTDKVVVMQVADISDIKYRVEWAVGEYSEEYGKTAETSLFSHSGLDGPIGSKPSKHNALEGYQMSLEGWSKIDFNWGKDANMNFFGCNSANSDTDYGDEGNFALNISALDNFKNTLISGQQKSSFPSIYTDAREYNSDMSSGQFKTTKEVYMVGSDGGKDDVFFNDAYQMGRAKNGKKLTPSYQEGTREPIDPGILK
ncbi:RHS repeat-associated core domain-containing protein [Fluviicola taffensis]|uniref:RHS repeat domain-containing protein n=1 Tax=Fluviicola taffensis TaxID=191579 RepID=UPI003137F84C